MTRPPADQCPFKEVYSPAERQVPVLAATIAQAFHGLPASQYLMPDPKRRSELLKKAFELDVTDTMQHGIAYATAAGEAVALWMPAGTVELPAPELDPRLAQIDRDLALRYREFHRILHRSHPRGRIHYWLTILAVRPARQGRGLGSKLLDHHHAYLDSQQLPAYLEAASISARALYHRHGYTEIGDPITLPNKSPMFPMWREPRAAQN
jgi:GNAT superfamily N-acetyltransferase